MALPPQLSFAFYVSAFALGFPLNLLAHARLRLTRSLVYVLHLSWFPGLPGSLGSQLTRPARLSFSILLFFLPLVITAFCYVGCLRALAHSGLSHKRKLRAAWVAGGALLTLMLCLGPYNASNVASFINPDLGGAWRKLGLITGAWSVVLNPLVTGYLGKGPGRGTVCISRTHGGTIQK
ncbi:hypothetical protein ACRRTK_000516 [Alexandromys fortis]